MNLLKTIFDFENVLESFYSTYKITLTLILIIYKHLQALFVFYILHKQVA